MEIEFGGKGSRERSDEVKNNSLQNEDKEGRNKDKRPDIEDDFKKDKDAIKDGIFKKYGNVKYYRLSKEKGSGVKLGFIKDGKEFIKLKVIIEKYSKHTGKKDKKGEPVEETFHRVLGIDEIKTIPIEGEIKVDKFVTMSRVDFEDGSTVYISEGEVDNIDDFIVEVEGRTTARIKDSGRKWYNKIIGYRSKKKWKMGLATLLYIMVFFITLGMFIGGEPENKEDSGKTDETSEATEEKEEVSDENLEEDVGDSSENKGNSKELDEETAYKDLKDGSEKENKEKEEKDGVNEGIKEDNKVSDEQKVEDEVKDIVYGEVGEEDVKDIIINKFDDGYFVNISYKGTEGWTNEGSLDLAKDDISNILVEMSKTDIKFRDVSGLDFNVNYTFVDKYGDKSESVGVRASFDGEIIDKLQFDSGYEISDLESLTSDYFVHPGMVR